MQKFLFLTKFFLTKFWPVIFLVFLWFIFASPYFLKDRVPFPSTYQVNHFHPWLLYEKYWGPVKNGAMPDIIDQIYPWKHFTIETLKKGEIPFWNPYNFSGNPNLANYQTAVFSPFNILFFVLPFIDAWSILILIQPLLAGLFMLFLLRELKTSKSGTLIGSLSFMFCGFSVVWMAYGTLSMSIAFLPLALFAVKRSFNKLSFFPLLLLVISMPLSFFSGHFQTSLYFFGFTLFFLVFESVTERKPKETLLCLLAIVLGLSLSLFQIFPSIQFYLNAARSGIFIKNGGIPFTYLANIFSPDFYGNPVTRNDWFGYYAEWASFIGIIPLMLSLFSLMKRKNKEVLFFFIVGIIALILSLDSPIQAIVGSLKIPVISTSDPNRIIVLFSFSFAVLSAFGLDSLYSFIKERKLKRIFAPLFSIWFLIGFIWILLFIFKVMPSDKLSIAKRNLVLPTILLLVSSFGIVLNIIINKKKVIKLFFFTLVLFTAFDSLRFVQKWMPFDSKEIVFQDVPAISAIKKNIGYGRVFGNLGGQVNSYYDLASIEGYDPLYIGRYGEFIRASQTGEFTEAERSVVKIDRNGKYVDRVLDFLGVNIIYHPIADTSQSWAYPVWKDTNRFELLFKDDRIQIFKNKSAMPRASIFYKYEVINNKYDVIKRFYSSDFDYRNTLILEENPSINSINEGNNKLGQASIISYTPNKIEIEASTKKPGFLFISDNYYPSWKVKVNGAEAKIYKADYTFRAVKIPEGKSNIIFYYSF